MLPTFPKFEQAIAYARNCLETAPLVHSLRWQGVEIIKKPEMATFEHLHFSFKTPMNGVDLIDYQTDICPNLPWADNHFEQERVSGDPINPGNTWKDWPYGHSAAAFLEDWGFGEDRKQFNHSYAERYWPKFAGMFPDGILPDDGEAFMDAPAARGIRYEYGDLYDLCALLAEDPYTRQAYLPIFFPEDTGGGAKRAPCTLGYQFIMRGGKLDITYWIRSCDFVRHFRDDIYLTVRLAMWVIDQCRKIADERDLPTKETWDQVKTGDYIMHITSLHLFKNDFPQVFGYHRAG